MKRLLLLASLLLGATTPLRGVEAAAGPQSWAILIGVEKYHQVTPLRHIVNDIERIEQTLKLCGGFDPRHMLMVTDEQISEAGDVKRSGTEPFNSKAALVEKLSDWLERPNEGDQLIVYFSGHGFATAERKTYLAPIDLDPQKIADTGIDVAWFRDQVAACKATNKLLIIDACHAGADKGDFESGLDAQTIGNEFKQLPGVVTLASSRVDEKSLLWDDKQQSLFSYWLNQGMRGFADENANGVVTIDELYEFAELHVSKTAEILLGRPQHPVRIIRTDIAGVPTVLQLRPQELDTVLKDLAELVALEIRQNQIQRVGVLEFVGLDAQLQRKLGRDYALLGQQCAQRLETFLSRLAGGRFQVVDQDRLSELIQEQEPGFNVESLRNGKKMASLAKGDSQIALLALGQMATEKPVGNKPASVMGLKCELLGTDNPIKLASFGGRVLLTPEEWSLMGKSFTVDAPPAPTANQDPLVAHLNQQQALANQVAQQTQQPHPYAQSNKPPMWVKVMVNGDERRGIVRGNDYIVGLDEGEVYELWIEDYRTASDQQSPVLMRLLVDGLNTMLEDDEAKGITTRIVGKIANIETCKWWVLDVKDLPRDFRNPPTYAVRGFVSKKGKDGRLYEFKVVQAAQSLAAQRSFFERIGLITAAFYRPSGVSRTAKPDVGTTTGKERQENLEKDERGLTPGAPLLTINIRYVSMAEFRRLEAGQ